MNRTIGYEKPLNTLPLNAGGYILSLDVNEGIKRRILDLHRETL